MINHIKALRNSAEIHIYQDVSGLYAVKPDFESKDNSPGAGGNPESLVKASNLDEVDQEIKPKSGAEAMHSIEESQQ